MRGGATFKIADGKKLQEWNEAGHRQNGKTFTIYNNGYTGDNPEKNTSDWATLIAKLEIALEKAGVTPSNKAPLDKKIEGAKYCTYRCDKDKNGFEIVSYTIHSRVNNNTLTADQAYNPDGVYDPLEKIDFSNHADIELAANGNKVWAENTSHIKRDSRLEDLEKKFNDVFSPQRRSFVGMGFNQADDKVAFRVSDNFSVERFNGIIKNPDAIKIIEGKIKIIQLNIRDIPKEYLSGSTESLESRLNLHQENIQPEQELQLKLQELKLQEIIAAKIRNKEIQTFNTNKGDIKLINGDGIELTKLQKLLTDKGIETEMVKAGNEFPEGLRIRSNSMNDFNELLAQQKYGQELAEIRRELENMFIAPIKTASTESLASSQIPARRYTR
ncbi:MAG: hypothetical protein WCJ33_06630 [Pseudomonadota bacterium]